MHTCTLRTGCAIWDLVFELEMSSDFQQWKCEMPIALLPLESAPETRPVAKKDQCQEHIADDLTRPWPRLANWWLVFHTCAIARELLSHRLDNYILRAIWKACKTILEPWGHPGRPWKMGEAGRTRVGPEPEFHSVWIHFGTFFWNFLLALRLEMSISFRACFQVTVCTDVWVEVWIHGALKTSFSHCKYYKKQFFTESAFYGFRGRSVLFFGGLGRFVLTFCCPGHRLENWWFSVLYRIQSLAGGGAS